MVSFAGVRTHTLGRKQELRRHVKDQLTALQCDVEVAVDDVNALSQSESDHGTIFTLPDGLSLASVARLTCRNYEGIGI